MGKQTVHYPVYLWPKLAKPRRFEMKLTVVSLSTLKSYKTISTTSSPSSEI